MQKFPIQELASQEIQKFLVENETAEPWELVLKNQMILGMPSSIIADQISARRKAKFKLPRFYETPGIIYPPSVNLEQSSSELSARFKIDQALRHVTDRKVLIDLTGGFGVDAFYFSQIFREVIYVEPEEGLLELARHNHRTLGSRNISYHHSSAENFIAQYGGRWSVAFIDPSRRSQGARKVAGLRDSSPDICQLQHLVYEKTHFLLTKASPLLDIRAGLSDLSYVERITVIAIDNDCKELLFLGRKGYSAEPVIHTANIISTETQSFAFNFSEETGSEVHFSAPKKYLYEPNVAILKAGAFKLVATSFGLAKLEANSHLYTSDEFFGNFPGRIFLSGEIMKASSKLVETYLPGRKANIIIRNYPSTVQDLKSRLKIKEGGDKYLLATSAAGKKMLIIANRLK